MRDSVWNCRENHIDSANGVCFFGYLNLVSAVIDINSFTIKNASVYLEVDLENSTGCIRGVYTQL